MGNGGWRLEHTTKRFYKSRCYKFLGFWVALLGRESLEVAFANYRFWISLGLAIGFFLIRFTTIDQFLLISFIILLVGILCYFIIEIYDLFIVILHFNIIY